MEAVDANETVEDVLSDNNPGRQSLKRALIQNSGASNRSSWLNLLMVLLLAGGAALFITMYLEFWILDMNLTKDPSPVWAQAMWFLPQALVVFLVLRTLVMGIQTSLLQAPAVWMVGMAFIAFVFNSVAIVFYQRLFWQCVTKKGNFENLEDHICEKQLVELSTIAWSNFLFLIHDIGAMITGVLIYSSDSERFQELRSGIMAGVRGLRSRAKKLRLPGKSAGADLASPNQRYLTYREKRS